MPAPIPLLIALFFSIVIGATAAILAWREGSKPGARPLVLLLIGQIWWSTSLVFRLRAPTVDGKLFWLGIMWVGVVIIPVGWLLFALDYTGRDKFLNRRYVALFSVIPILTIVLVALGPIQDLLIVKAGGFHDSGILTNETAGIWYWVVAIYTYVMGGIGIVLLFNLIVSQTFVFRKQAVALILGILAPWATNILYLTDVLKTGIDPTPIAFSLSGIIYLLALRRFKLLDTNPAPNKQAQQLVFDGVQEGAIIVDMEDHIIDINEQALEILQRSRSEILGSDATQFIPKYEDFPETGTMQDYLTIDTKTGRHEFEVEITQITSRGGKPIGRVLTINEVTDLLRQQQRLEVLNRVLRHNIRTEANLILGYTAELEEKQGEKVRNRVEKIEDLGQKGRDAIELFRLAREDAEPRALGSVLEGSIKDLKGKNNSVQIEYNPSEANVSVNKLLVTVFRHAIDNAIIHNDSPNPQVWINSAVNNGIVHVEIADNGPGIPEHELSVLSEGVESPLDHASGLGLWIIKWGTDLAGGTVQFEANEPTGTVVSIRVPIVD